jgi:hypothetical protein
MWTVDGEWRDDGSVSPLDEVPGEDRERGKQFESANLHGVKGRQKQRESRLKKLSL